VLDNSDKLSDLAESLGRVLQEVVGLDSLAGRQALEKLDMMKEAIFDIVATQTYQDVARQKMEVIIKDLSQMRNWLIEALVVLNIRHDASVENVEKKTALLREVTVGASTESEKQDLVDDLLAEFGF
jgi:chemotaxis protein CheZ